jgi:hypothetical protein
MVRTAPTEPEEVSIMIYCRPSVSCLTVKIHRAARAAGGYSVLIEYGMFNPPIRTHLDADAEVMDVVLRIFQTVRQLENVGLGRISPAAPEEVHEERCDTIRGLDEVIRRLGETIQSDRNAIELVREDADESLEYSGYLSTMFSAVTASSFGVVNGFYTVTHGALMGARCLGRYLRRKAEKASTAEQVAGVQ